MISIDRDKGLDILIKISHTDGLAGRKSAIFRLLLIVMFLSCIALQGDENELGTSQDNENIHFTIQAQADSLQTGTDIDSLTTSSGFMEEEDSADTESTSARPKVKEINFTKDDIVDFCVENKNEMVYFDRLSPIPYQDRLKINNYWLLRPQLPVQSYQSRLTNFGEIRQNTFTQTRYDYEVSLVRLHAGLGEYDKNFAHITFMKDKLFTINNLNFRGDFKAKNESKQRDNNMFFDDHQSADAYFQMEYKFADFQLTAHYLNTDRDLHPQYYNFKNNFTNATTTINERWLLWDIELAWKYLFIGYAENKSTMTMRAQPTLSFENNAFVAGLKYKDEQHNAKLTVQRENKYRLKNARTPNTEHRTSKPDTSINATYSLKLKEHDITIDALLYDKFEKIDMSSQLSFNAYKDFYVLADVAIKEIVRPDIEYVYENHQTSLFKGGVGYRLSATPALSVEALKLDIDFMMGQKEITQFRPEATTDSLSKKLTTFSSSLKANIPIHKYLINVYNDFEYDKDATSFYYIPKLTNVVDLSLSRLLDNDNKLTLGSRLHFIGKGKGFKSDNPVLDVYFSIGITKLFDITAQLNNIYQTQYFGNEYLNDWHFTSYLTWYFLN